MRITIRLFAHFRIGRFKEAAMECEPAATVRQVSGELGIPDSEVGIIFINGRNARMDQALAEGDVLSLFPLVGGG